MWLNFKRTKPILWQQLCLTVVVLAISLTVKGVAFKLENSTTHIIRAKIFDRGQWSDYVEIHPGECKRFGTKVARSGHRVVIEIKTHDGWDKIYSTRKKSVLYTRIVHVTENNNKHSFTWYSEPPGCRDCPSNNNCLHKSGWRLLKKRWVTG